ncbi:uncharacterized protein DUF4133 [Pontibacter ummariensis]|uniref:DUF4133 domain-containing protein n=1 Tax=Pontibacter ummariensis TaxID=1610492 RepID=A0A239LEM6_9BACT|nr:DUF4133 domain-containing protein [Pontibacter ummariensis]PRY03647.1 uncharacterized protein DUF4133 [Pontibacter ummariensis]SNT28931.1 protein of unknown function [Pontibacter ummariensis]
METSVYRINKGINKPMEFKGLRAQYIGYLAVGLVALLLGFTLLYLAGVDLLLCVTVVFLSGGALFTGVYHLDRTYGQYGLLKRFARRSVPRCVRVRSRKVFMHLKRKEENHGSRR